MKLLALFLLTVFSANAAFSEAVTVGSKRFTESYVLGEIARLKLDESGLTVQHRQGMGGTIILWQALTGGSIAAYPEYTGTIVEEILKSKRRMSLQEIRDALKPLGIGVTEELGFNNTYALVMGNTVAMKLGIDEISDLKDHPSLRVGVTHEFLNRQDGWKPLARRYGLTFGNVRAIDHALGYQALASGQVDIKDAYSTDAKIAENDLVVLKDDLQFFPSYKAVFLYRLDAPEPVVETLGRLAGKIDETRMTELNALAEKSKDYTKAASSFVSEDSTPAANNLVSETLRLTLRHLQLVGVSLLFAVIAGIPLGIAASRPGMFSQLILGFVGIVQTIPSLALLAILVPLPFFGISATTAIFALFLYSLLPIVRSTASGLMDIPDSLKESAEALGLEPSVILRKIYLPMASRSILSGIKTSAVINVGTATLAALIGAGGLGEPIISGLNLNDHATILRGAVPAAILALIVQLSFDTLDLVIIPKGLRLKRANQ